VPKKREPRNHRPTAVAQQRLDLTQFASLTDALAKIEPGDRYQRAGEACLGVDLGIGMPAMFWLAMLARAEGLHQAIAREARAANPHAVFPLLRALAEAVVLVIYVVDHPAYIEVVARRPDELATNGPKRKSIQALISYASKRATGAKAVYAELSEATHFGSIAMWMPHRLTGGEGSDYLFSWQQKPRWKDEEQALVACALTLELAEAMEHTLREFAERHLLPPRAAGPTTALQALEQEEDANPDR
jgi:hypothetical protein